MNSKKNFSLVCLLLISTILHAEPTKERQTASPLVAVGNFNSGPLIIASENDGSKWSFVESPNIGYELKSVSCNGKQCTAIGNAESEFPLIFTSHDAAHSWQLNKNISGLPINMKSPYLRAMSCVGNICNIVGKYSKEDKRHLPLLLRSEDSGKTWKFIEIIDYPNIDHFKELNISCSGLTCIVAGQFAMESNDKAMPHYFLLASHDTGRTWTKIDKIRNFPLAENLSNTLNNVSCDGANCVAVGLDLSLWPLETKPFIVYSDDAGKTWTYVSKVWGLKPVLSQLLSWMRLVHVNCKDKICVAGGMRIDTYPNQFSNKPLLLISRDAGKTWFYSPVEISGITAPEMTAIQSLGCSSTHCVVIGEGSKGNFILTSKNSGISWEVTKTIPGTSDDFQQNARFRAMSCSDKPWVITGDYYNFETKIGYPFFLISHDDGTTWQFKNDIEMLPQSSFFTLMGLTGSQVNYKDDNFIPQITFGKFKQNQHALKDKKEIYEAIFKGH